MSIRPLALVLLAPLVLSGCALLPFGQRGPRVEVTALDGGTETAELGTEALPVTTGDLDVAYDEVAIITVGPLGLGSTERLIYDLRRAAERLGADAIVRLDIDQYADEDGFTRRIATGTAVRYR